MGVPIFDPEPVGSLTAMHVAFLKEKEGRGVMVDKARSKICTKAVQGCRLCVCVCVCVRACLFWVFGVLFRLVLRGGPLDTYPFGVTLLP